MFYSALKQKVKFLVKRTKKKSCIHLCSNTICCKKKNQNTKIFIYFIKDLIVSSVNICYTPSGVTRRRQKRKERFPGREKIDIKDAEGWGGAF